jgi:hypothetical protein
MEIDVRDVSDVIDTIRFYGEDDLEYSAKYLVSGNNFCLEIHDGDDFVVIRSKQHALDLIKALEKSFDLGWLK